MQYKYNYTQSGSSYTRANGTEWNWKPQLFMGSLFGNHIVYENWKKKQEGAEGEWERESEGERECV